jgi:hypothetical protein
MLQGQVHDLVEERDQLRSILQKHEWNHVLYNDRCPECNHRAPAGEEGPRACRPPSDFPLGAEVGHAPGCAIAVALSRDSEEHRDG